MTCLQRGILAVVRETEQLSRERAQAGIASVHPAKRAANKHCRRRTSTFRRKRREPVAITSRAPLRCTTTQAEPELPGEKPGARSSADLSGRRDSYRARPPATVVRLQPGIPRGVVLNPPGIEQQFQPLRRAEPEMVLAFRADAPIGVEVFLDRKSVV